MQVVSFETAKRLKKAGFPQPEIMEFGLAFWVKNYTDHILALTDYDNIGIKMRENYSFAPSATDILKELGGQADLRFSRNGWTVSIFQNQYHSDSFNSVDNPAEACAAAWLAKNEKP